MSRLRQNDTRSVHHRLVFPPITECKQKERHTDGEVVKAHEKKVIVDKGKAQDDEGVSSALDSIEKIRNGKWEEDNVETQKDFLGDEGWKHEH